MIRKIMVIAYGLSIASFLCFFALDESIFLVIGGSGRKWTNSWRHIANYYCVAEKEHAGQMICWKPSSVCLTMRTRL